MHQIIKHKAQTIRLLSLVLLTALSGTFYKATPLEAIGSPNYQIREDFIGGGGTINSSSPNFQASDTIGGGLSVGNASGTSYKTQTGATTTSDPALTVSVNTSSVTLGSLTTGATSTGTATFSVLNYTSYGYIVKIIGTPPNNGSHTLTNLAAPTTSTAGTEQFGINLRANTAPATFGSDPVQVPDNTFSFGAYASGYGTVNSYKYISGDTIASAPKSSGKTTYTISYIANIATNTQNGSYSANQTILVVGTY